MAEIILRRHTGLQRLRWDILTVVMCCLAPYFVLVMMKPPSDGLGLLSLSLFGSLIASIISIYLLRSLSGFPGVQNSVNIVPSFLFGYGLVFIVFLFTRFYYSRSLFITAFGLCVLAFYIVAFYAQRRRDVVLGIVPYGAASELIATATHVQWRILASPDEPVSALSAIVVDLRADLPDEWERRLTDYALDGLPVYHSKQLKESLTGQVQLEHLSENSFGSLVPVSIYMTTKHAIDWCVALVTTILLLPVFLLISMAVRFDSPGPAIFRQERIGYRGKPYVVYKFRSMTVKDDTMIDEHNHAQMQMPSNAQRITRVGRFLRISRLDELPQIFNILKGEMSWIGPRPEIGLLVDLYDKKIPFFRYRHIVRPGITGWAQVNQGHVHEISDIQHKLHYDFYYIRHFSPWIDLLIVAKTLHTMITGFGAR